MKNILGWVIGIVVVWFIFSNLSSNEGTYSGNQVYESRCEDDISEYKYALEEANSNIETANSSIDNAQYSAWETYDEMGEALDSLEQVDVIDEPGYSDECEDEIEDYSYALEEANANIEEVNSSIEDAQSYAWEAYEEMGDAIDGLQTVDTVSEP